MRLAAALVLWAAVVLAGAGATPGFAPAPASTAASRANDSLSSIGLRAPAGSGVGAAAGPAHAPAPPGAAAPVPAAAASAAPAALTGAALDPDTPGGALLPVSASPSRVPSPSSSPSAAPDAFSGAAAAPAPAVPVPGRRQYSPSHATQLPDSASLVAAAGSPSAPPAVVTPGDALLTSASPQSATNTALITWLTIVGPCPARCLPTISHHLP
jgi:DNA polymerase-3 subunit gamma/tau